MRLNRFVFVVAGGLGGGKNAVRNRDTYFGADQLKIHRVYIIVRYSKNSKHTIGQK
jgi:hypothetical protein